MNKRFVLAGVLAFGLVGSSAPALANLTIVMTSDETPSWEEPQQTERFSKVVKLGPSGSVSLENLAGDIVVTGGTGNEVVIEAVKRGRTEDDLRQISIEVVNAEGRVAIATRYPRRAGGSWHSHAEVDYTITVPRNAEVRVKSVSGDIQVSAVNGELRAESVSGDVRVSNATQVESIGSVSGDVIVRDITSTGTLAVTSISGDLGLHEVKARSIEGSTVSGDATLSNVACDRLAFKTVSGEVEFSGPLTRAGRYELTSHSGDVVVRILNRIGFELSATSFSGDIRSDLPLTVQFGGPSSGERRRRTQEVRGTYGDGAASLELSSFSGDIRVLEGAGAPKPPVKR
jgi:hypothetical protein